MEYIPFSNPQAKTDIEVRKTALESDGINTSIINIDGRYPELGWATNEDCYTVLCVSHKRGRIVTRTDAGEVSTDVSADGVVILKPKEEYVLEGQMRLFRIMAHLAVTEQRNAETLPSSSE